LDEARRNADRQPKSHDASLIIEKWNDAVVGPKWRERPTRMFVDCRHQGALTECCLESAALDRIFYNLANNACRHAATNRLDMAIFPISEAPGECLRFVLSNEVAGEDETYLRSLLPTDGADSADKGSGLSLLALFDPQVSTTGSGFGLTVVADFVAGAFGLRDRAEALRERYVGAVLEGHTFRVWFHWPAANDALPAKTDDYHHPQESLSEP
jgi:signal transduction histidine kinase